MPDAFAVWHRFDAGPCAACRQSGAHGVAVVGAIGKQDAAFAMEMPKDEPTATKRAVWNAGRTVGAKRALKPKQI
jgi:hypothetical protein